MGSRSHLTYSSAIVLQAAARGYRYGFDIMDASGLPGGTVYPALRRLEQSGFVKSSWESDEIARKAKRPRRRYYETTPQGAEALAEAVKRFRLLQQTLEAETPVAEPDSEHAR
jgi:DNA-binding PadR family transcriptional regulator